MAHDNKNLKVELQRMCQEYSGTLRRVTQMKSLNDIKRETNSSHFVRIHQSIEFWPCVVQCLKQRHFPKAIVDVVFQYVNTAGKKTYNPLMICTWASDPCLATTGRQMVGSPPCAIEFRNGCDQHRDDIDISKLSEQEKVSYDINTTFIDEVWVDQVIYPQLKQIEEWVTLFSALCFDSNGEYFVYSFFFATFSELEKDDHVIEFGWRMGVPAKNAVEAIRWMKAHNIDMNLKTREVTLERFDTQQ